MTTLESQYRQRYETYLVPLAKELEKHLVERLKDTDRIDRITARAKAVDRFVEKASRLNADKSTLKYSDPLTQIQDQIGARIITFYLSDVGRVAKEVKRYFGHIEEQLIVPDVREFDYEGRHFILHIPQDIVREEWDENVPEFFELQIKTLFQHAWGEANHDLGYKPAGSLSRDEQRRIAFTAAQAWGADRILDEMFLSRGEAGSR